MALKCACCEKKIGMFEGKSRLLDGYVCANCLKKAYIPYFVTQKQNIRLEHLCATEMKNICLARQCIEEVFTATKQERRFKIDEDNQLFWVDMNEQEPLIFEYSNLVKVERIENNGAVNREKIISQAQDEFSGSVIRKRMESKKESSADTLCSSLKVRFHLENTYTSTIDIELRQAALPIEKKSRAYKGYCNMADKIIILANQILEYNRNLKAYAVLEKGEVANLRVALLSSTNEQQEYRCKAGKLYTANKLFAKCYKYAEALQVDRIYILSSKHGLLYEEHVLSPYKLTLHNLSEDEKILWASTIKEQLEQRFDLTKVEFIVLADAEYTNLLLEHGVLIHYELPLQKMGEKEKMAFMRSEIYKINKEE